MIAPSYLIFIAPLWGAIPPLRNEPPARPANERSQK